MSPEQTDLTDEEWAALVATLIATPPIDPKQDDAYLDDLDPPQQLSLPPPPDA